jgi:hypothetical protein
LPRLVIALPSHKRFARHHRELQKSHNPSRNHCSLVLKTVLGTELEACAKPQRPHPQRASRNPQCTGEPVAVLDLVAFVALVVAQNQRAVVGRELIQTRTEAFEATIAIGFWFVQRGLRLWCFLQRPGLKCAVPTHLEQKHARDANAIGGGVADDLSVADLLRATIDGLISVFLGRRAASPFEEPDKVATNLEIAIGRDVPIGSKQRQQAVEGGLCEGPHSTSRRIYRHSPWSVNAAQ